MVSLNFLVIVIGTEPTFLRNVQPETGKQDLRDLAYLCSKAELFIGASTGLTWLAYVSGCKTLLISDHTPTFTEAYTWKLGGENLSKIAYREPDKRVTTEDVINKLKEIFTVSKNNK